MKRSSMLSRAAERKEPFDVLVIGGGCTGLGCALDAAARGLAVLLLEKNDFGKGTSSRSTKLVHGGVRYLRQGRFRLVREALRERWLMRGSAPDLVTKRKFIVPCFTRREKAFYGSGLHLYDRLAGRYSFGASRLLSGNEVAARLPRIKASGLRGGVEFCDGGFDDTRYLARLAAEAAERNAVLLNYAPVKEFVQRNDGTLCGAVFVDRATGRDHEVRARALVNAAGIFADEVRALEGTSPDGSMTFSQGTHIVVDADFLGSEDALMIPRTSDGRVLFAIPWHGKVLAGTTDVPVPGPVSEPAALEGEVELILGTMAGYLENAPDRRDIKSVFSGIRPLSGTNRDDDTPGISREHNFDLSAAGLITITGGKWTTYRKIAEEAIDLTLRTTGLSGSESTTADIVFADRRSARIAEIASSSPDLLERIDPEFGYTKADVLSAVRHEMAVTLEDVLARRTRMLFLDARAAVRAAPEVAALISGELGWDENRRVSELDRFEEIAKNYIVS